MKEKLPHAEYGIKLMPRPNEQSWEKLWAIIELSVKNQEIRGDGAARLYEMKENNYTYKQISAAYQEEIKKADEMKAKIAQNQQNNQMQLAQAASQMKEQQLGNEAQRQAYLDNQIIQGKKEIEDKRAENKMHLKLIDNATKK